ncbi:hypothetical protein HPB47_023538 [Ixodes persulcatus]|uniref:Uncharacterized protein n=1 Tax=Ixodes persulcatus TaxID=34615 RepID=A0AC60Q8Z1_IXOPE|nr:hypothetical protein HPB47_023538 [Ixodes persulcatus]
MGSQQLGKVTSAFHAVHGAGAVRWGYGPALNRLWRRTAATKTSQTRTQKSSPELTNSRADTSKADTPPTPPDKFQPSRQAAASDLKLLGRAAVETTAQFNDSRGDDNRASRRRLFPKAPALVNSIRNSSLPLALSWTNEEPENRDGGRAGGRNCRL